jgi:hypothetical protein
MEMYMYFVTLYAQVLLTLGSMANVNEAHGALIIEEWSGKEVGNLVRKRKHYVIPE